MPFSRRFDCTVLLGHCQITFASLQLTNHLGPYNGLEDSKVTDSAAALVRWFEEYVQVVE